MDRNIRIIPALQANLNGSCSAMKVLFAEWYIFSKNRYLTYIGYQLSFPIVQYFKRNDVDRSILYIY
jgi:hypothetical protein